jgi:hypothetical protein
MKNLKSLFIAVTLLLSINMTTNKAQAGVVLMPASIIGGTALLILGIPAAGAGSLIWVIEDAFGGAEAGPLVFLAGLALIVLDEEVDTNNEISFGLETQFPMINDKSVFDDLASMIQAKVSNFENTQIEIKIQLSEKEVREVLDRVDSTGIESNIECLVKELI